MNEQPPITNPSPTTQTSPEVSPKESKKTWSPPTMIVLEISATAFNAGIGEDGNAEANVNHS